MDDQKPLTTGLRELLHERRNTSPDQYKLDLLAKELPEIRKAMAGVNWLLNLAVANSRELKAENEGLRTQVDALHVTVFDLRASIGEQQLQIDSAAERIENMAQWAKTKGKQ